MNITVFERNSYIGGRSTTVPAYDDPLQPVELGASIFVQANKILQDAVKAFELSTGDDENSPPRPNTAELGIWNGKEFIVTAQAMDSWWDTAKLLWRYGLAPIRTNSLMKETVNKFLSMYDKPHFPWSSLSQVVQDVGLTAITAETGEQFLNEHKISKKFADEVIQARYVILITFRIQKLLDERSCQISLIFSFLSD